ncbi:hypothetical protein HMPREF2874_08775 [Rothia sp. HMSC068F09]|nr:hypothetical protein HMPREF2874_08775 [Rothia sp. HMSC068F09]
MDAMSQLPQNNEAFDYNPEYANLYRQNGNGQPIVGSAGGPLQPASGFPSQETGRSAENLSLLFGILSLVCIPGIRWTLYAIPFSLILSVLGIWQARVARRHGARATAGMILSAMGIVVVLLLVAIIILILNALSGIH